VSSAIRRSRESGGVGLGNAGEAPLALIACAAGDVVRRGWIVNRMLSWSAALRRDVLGASHVHRRLAGNSGSETEADPAVMASLVGHRAHGVALGVVA
jgi:hypothetical protein